MVRDGGIAERARGGLSTAAPYANRSADGSGSREQAGLVARRLRRRQRAREVGLRTTGRLVVCHDDLRARWCDRRALQRVTERPAEDERHDERKDEREER